MIESILDQCLEEIRAGRATVADCLAKFPEQAEELRPLLEMAVAIEEVPDVKPSDGFKRATRELLSRLGQMDSAKTDGRINNPSAPDPGPERKSVRTFH